MRCLVQRVAEASVRVDGEVVGAIGGGLLVLVCAMAGDGAALCERMARKVAALRIFRDGDGKMNLPVTAVGGSILAVSQFTLAADGAAAGNRPGFSNAAPPEEAKNLYRHFCTTLRGQGLTVAEGVFGAEMRVSLVNDGPVTIWLDMPSATG